MSGERRRGLLIKVFFLIKFQRIILFFSIVIFATITDQVTKDMAWSALEQNAFNDIIIFEDWLSVRYAKNHGVAWSFLEDYPIPLTGLTLMISLVLCVYALYSSVSKKVLCSWALVVGGAFGNIVDRLQGVYEGLSDPHTPLSYFVYVRDFISIYWGKYQWPIFNVADSLICIGVFYLFFHSFFIDKLVVTEIDAETANNP